MLEGGHGVDEHFIEIDICLAFGWTHEEYMQRPLWFDVYYGLKLKADKSYQEKKNKT